MLCFVCDYALVVMVRPRVHPEGTTASERVAASTSALVEAGGARKTFRLSPEANAALNFLLRQKSAPPTATALIEQLLIAAALQAKRARNRQRDGEPKG